MDGELTRPLGQIRPGQKIQLAVFGINGPISNPPANYILMRSAKLSFYRVAPGPVAITPREVNVEVIRLDPAIDAIVPPNPKDLQVRRRLPMHRRTYLAS